MFNTEKLNDTKKVTENASVTFLSPRANKHSGNEIQYFSSNEIKSALIRP